MVSFENLMKATDTSLKKWNFLGGEETIIAFI